jgi:hypothetical protein
VTPTDQLRQIGQPDVDAWTDDDGEIDSLLVAKDRARADRELLAAARSHWDALCDVVDAAEALRRHGYGYPLTVQSNDRKRALETALDTLAQLGEGAS